MFHHLTAHDKARELYDSSQPLALHTYLEAWKAGKVAASTRRILDVVHAYTLIQAHATQEDIVIGDLRIRLFGQRVEWKGIDAGLTVAEFKVVKLLIDHIGEFVSYRSIYDVVHYVGFTAGTGEDGWKMNVRSLIKRLRKKFLQLDPGFEMIENYCGHGYRWCQLAPAVIEVPVLVPVRMPQEAA
jgi:DNA-binding response OmpR family regulator